MVPLSAVGYLAASLLAAAAPASATVATLHVSSAHPRQLRGVTFDASASRATGGIRSYRFQYGDGTQDTTNQPYMLHGYRYPGRFQARVTITGQNGATTTSQPVTVKVRDGVAPVVRINSPRPGQRAHLAPRGVTIRGTVVDPGRGHSGVRTVTLALQFLSIRARAGCFWYDGKHSLVVRVCGSPLFFRASVDRGRWHFRLNPSIRFPAGLYAVRARATDRAGNVSDFYAVRLRTILGFELRP